MLFTVLGPVALTVAGHAHALPRAQRRAVLGYLLLNANRVVSPDGIVDALWAGAEPRSARNQVHAAVSVVRTLLRTAGFPDALVRSQAGYLLTAEPDQLDLLMFEDLVRRARGIAAAGQAATAAGLYRAGLDLWTGPALGGATGAYVEPARVHLAEQRLSATEELLDQELACGQHHDVVAELGPLIAAHPFQERFHAQLMLALYRSGRQADALEVYRDARRVLADELGLEPGAELRRLEHAVLTSDPGLELPAETPARVSALEPPPAPDPGVLPIPAQLPAEVSGFTGRAEEMRHLDELAAGGPAGGAVVITAIAGTAGVGKTALAVHWCRTAATGFPDGQLYINLRGYDPGQPVHPSVALASFLRALGLTTEQIPAELDEAAALLRSLLAGRRMLVLLDNAASADQVRPLLPGDPGCLVVVTSRNRLSGLVARDGAQRLALDLLSKPDAVTLLGRLLGPERVAAEPAATEELAVACGRLPLALRVTAANLAGQTDRRIAAHVAAMTEDSRLGMLAVDGDDSSAVRVAFEQSYAGLATAPRRLFRLLGLVPGPDFGPAVAAELAEIAPAEAGRLLDRLADASLLDAHPDARYAFHDLIRLFARERAATDEGSEALAAARTRLYDYYLGTVDAAVRLLHPNRLRLTAPLTSGASFTEPADALTWLDREQANLVAAALDAAAHGPVEMAWLLADALRSYLWRRMSTASWKAVTQAGLAAAVAAREVRAQAALTLGMGLAHASVGEYASAIEYNSRAVALSLKTGWREVQAIALTNLGGAFLALGWLQHAADHYQRALAVNEELSRTSAAAMSLGNVGSVYLELGQIEQAADYLQQAVDRPELADSPDGGATPLLNLGCAHLYLGNLDAAERHLTRAIEAARITGRPDCHAPALAQLAAVNLERGRAESALEQATAALAMLEDTGDRYDQAVVLSVIGAVHLYQDEHQAAIDAHELALRYAQQTDSPFPQAIALLGLADCRLRLGQTGPARVHAEQALTIARRVGYRLLEGQALTTLAEIDLLDGEARLATTGAERALAIHQEISHRPGEAQTLRVLVRAGTVTADQSGGSS